MTTRMTKKDKFMDIATALENAGLLTDARKEFIDHEIGLLSRKNSTENRKPTKAQLDNIEFKNQIMEFLATCDEGVTASQVMKELGLSSNQKAAALLKSLQTEGKVVKEIVKGVSMFSVA